MQRAIVKSILSGDTVILRAETPPTKGTAAKERVVHLAGIAAPRLGSMVREDEPFAFAAREFLRPMMVGKLVQFQVTHSVEGNKTATNGSLIDREYGIVKIAPLTPGGPPQDVAMLVVSNGWAKTREGGRDGDEADRREQMRAAEAEAKAAGKGIWAEGGESQRTVSFQMPSDSAAFLEEHKGKDLDAIVEQVRDGSSIRVRLLLEDGSHQFVNLNLAGVKAPRAMSGRDGEASVASEEFGEEAKFFVESRLLQRAIKVQLLSAPVSLGAPPPAAGGKANAFGSLPAPQNVTSNIMIGTAIHPNGSIGEFLLAAGLGKIVDWHAGILAAVGGIDRLRAAEKTAKDKRIGIWEKYSPPTRAVANGGAANGSNGTAAPTTKGLTFDATVIRVWSADQVSLIEKGDASQKERRVQIASVRGPRGSAPREAYWANEAKEFLRKKLIGKTVHVLIDYVKPKEGDFEEKECVTIKYGGAHANIAEQLVEKGLATVLRHKRDDEDRASELDKLAVAEQTAVAEARGIHSPNEMTLPRITDASESGNKASQFLPSWKRAGKHAALVDFVASGSRFKLILPKENKKLTFVLAGVKAPRAARSANEKSEPYGTEGLQWSTIRYMQRDVEIAFESVDKQGGFIGTMYSNGQNVAVELVKEGLASVHSYSAEGLSYSRELIEAEETAKREKKGIWKEFDAEAEAEIQVDQSGEALKAEYLDVVVSSIKEDGPFTFSVQILTDSSIASLEQLMKDFSIHHRSTKPTANMLPKAGDLVSAQFSEDDQWYRAKVKRSTHSRREAEVRFIDYGNEEVVPFDRIRPLDAKFKGLAGQASEARLSFVQIVGKGSDYGAEALDRFKSLTEGRKLVANVDQREQGLLHLRLIDPSDPNSATDPLACLNADMVREGLATIDKSCRYAQAYPQVIKKLQQATEGAKADRLGIFEFGDVSED